MLAIPLAVLLALILSTAMSRQRSIPVRDSDVAANSSSFTYNPAGKSTAISALTYTKGAPAVLALTVFGIPEQGTDAQPASSAVISADLVNQTTHTVTFAGGARVRVTITRDARPWMSVELNQPATPSLRPGEQAHLQTTVHLGAAGRYDLSGELLGRGDEPAFTLSGS
ncbi:MAG: hypothetical protein NVSMB32_06400 [Actinomycetota bacterium]